jgi:Tol biopolymer transport system component
MRAPATSDPVLALNSNASPWGLWTVSVDGGEPELFFERPGFGATRPDWCWATGRIAITGIRGDRAELWLLDGDGRNLTHVPVGDPPRTRLFYPSWYPEGDAVAVTDYATHEILRVDVSTGEAVSLTDPAAVWAGMCSVSPNSGRGNPIAFAGQPPDEGYGVADNVLWILRPGSPPVPLDSRHGRTPAWSPTGDYLAFSSVRRRPAPAFTLHPRTLPPGASGVFVQHVVAGAASTAPAAGVTPYDVSAIHPKWAPGGATLVSMANDLDHTRMGLALIDLTA